VFESFSSFCFPFFTDLVVVGLLFLCCITRRLLEGLKMKSQVLFLLPGKRGRATQQQRHHSRGAAVRTLRTAAG
jgi:hypothetical protein